jgi:hypothetical protein
VVNLDKYLRETTAPHHASIPPRLAEETAGSKTTEKPESAAAPTTKAAETDDIQAVYEGAFPQIYVITLRSLTLPGPLLPFPPRSSFPPSA